MTIRFDGKVAIVTGAGNGLGRSHALALAERGAKVVINDLGEASVEAAHELANMIKGKGGEAIVQSANVANFDEVESMVKQVMDKWGRVDILVNNAGILRDKTFSKMSVEDFRLVVDVHLMGSMNCCKAVWDIMKDQEYGRIVMTSSSSGMYGNFGQSNYGAAKMAVIGLMNTLVLEGYKYNIKVNALAPTAGTVMTEGLIPQEAFDVMTTESVAAGLLTLCHEGSPNRYILCAGAGGYASTHIYENDGIYLPPEEQTPENITALFDVLNDSEEQQEFTVAGQQTDKFVKKALAHLDAIK